MDSKYNVLLELLENGHRHSLESIKGDVEDKIDIESLIIYDKLRIQFNGISATLEDLDISTPIKIHILDDYIIENFCYMAMYTSILNFRQIVGFSQIQDMKPEEVCFIMHLKNHIKPKIIKIECDMFTVHTDDYDIGFDFYIQFKRDFDVLYFGNGNAPNSEILTVHLRSLYSGSNFNKLCTNFFRIKYEQLLGTD